MPGWHRGEPDNEAAVERFFQCNPIKYFDYNHFFVYRFLPFLVSPNEEAAHTMGYR